MTIDDNNKDNDNNFINTIKKYSFIITMSATLLFYIFLMVLLFNKCSNNLNRWGKNLKYYTKINITHLTNLEEPEAIDINAISYNIDDYTKSNKITDVQKKRIKEQIYLIRHRAITNLRIARDLYCWMVVSVTILCISTIVSGICAYSITKKGWDDVDNLIKAIFVTSLGISLFTTFFHSFFQLQKNAEAKITLYQTYVNLEDYIFSSLTLGYLSELPENKSDTQQLSFSENLIQKIDKITQAYSMVFEFDAQSIPKLNDVIESVDGKNKN
jgi:hypothetical protein